MDDGDLLHLARKIRGGDERLSNDPYWINRLLSDALDARRKLWDAEHRAARREQEYEDDVTRLSVRNHEGVTCMSAAEIGQQLAFYKCQYVEAACKTCDTDGELTSLADWCESCRLRVGPYFEELRELKAAHAEQLRQLNMKLVGVDDAWRDASAFQKSLCSTHYDEHEYIEEKEGGPCTACTIARQQRTIRYLASKVTCNCGHDEGCCNTAFDASHDEDSDMDWVLCKTCLAECCGPRATSSAPTRDRP